MFDPTLLNPDRTIIWHQVAFGPLVWLSNLFRSYTLKFMLTTNKKVDILKSYLNCWKFSTRKDIFLLLNWAFDRGSQFSIFFILMSETQCLIAKSGQTLWYTHIKDSFQKLYTINLLKKRKILHCQYVVATRPVRYKVLTRVV